jgi:hypothetical protein
MSRRPQAQPASCKPSRSTVSAILIAGLLLVTMSRSTVAYTSSEFGAGLSSGPITARGDPALMP